MRICLEFLTESVKLENQEAVSDAVATLLRLARTDATGSGSTPVAVEEPTVKEDPPPKTKRKRRTQKELAAAKAAKEAEKQEAKEASEVDPVEETKTADVKLHVEPQEEVTEDQVKAAVVACVKRLTVAGTKSPTKKVVEILTALTGKKRVGEIAPEDYPKVIAGLSGDVEEDAEDLF